MERSGLVIAAKWSVVREWVFSMDSSPVLADLGGNYLKTSACHHVLTTLSVVWIFSNKIYKAKNFFVVSWKSFISIVKHSPCNLQITFHVMYFITQQKLQVSYYFWAHGLLFSVWIEHMYCSYTYGCVASPVHWSQQLLMLTLISADFVLGFSTGKK